MMECRSRKFIFDTIPVGIGCLVTGEGGNPGSLLGLCQLGYIWGGSFFPVVFCSNRVVVPESSDWLGYTFPGLLSRGNTLFMGICLHPLTFPLSSMVYRRQEEN